MVGKPTVKIRVHRHSTITFLQNYNVDAAVLSYDVPDENVRQLHQTKTRPKDNSTKTNGTKVNELDQKNGFSIFVLE
jgi:hypothetical protein